MTRIEDLARYGGLLCLDFINTVDWRRRAEPEEFLHAYGDVLTWGVLTGTLSSAEAEGVRTRLSAERARSAYRDAIITREAMHRTIEALVLHRSPAEGDLAILNEVIAEAKSDERLADRDGRVVWVNVADHHPHRILWTVALSFADLVVSDEMADVRECGGAGCGWYFLDTSKSRKRRWCSMRGCGNRAKASRHYYAKSVSSNEETDRRHQR